MKTDAVMMTTLVLAFSAAVVPEARADFFDAKQNPFAVDAGGGEDASEAGSPAGADQCFCKLEGKIDDCACHVDTVDYFNNMKIFPRLTSLLQKPYFRYFNYNPNRGCPFWDSASGKCAEKTCGVQECAAHEIPSGLKGAERAGRAEQAAAKYSKEAQQADLGHKKKGEDGGGGKGKEDCEDSDADEDDSVDETISAVASAALAEWEAHDDAVSRFCHVDSEVCPECIYVDLTLNPERYTGYRGESATRIWNAIYEENCFRPEDAAKDDPPDVAFLKDKVDDMCLEKRAFYRIVSGLHSSVSIHLCANYPDKQHTKQPGFCAPPPTWGPNIGEFTRRFHGEQTNGMGPYWLRNLYFLYLLELRALSKASAYLAAQKYYTGETEEDIDTQVAVKELLSLLRSFPDQFNESTMFPGGKAASVELRKQFQDKFRNISSVMDCVGCDKCKLWGKLQVTGLGTALKILFWADNTTKKNDRLAASAAAAATEEELQTLQPPRDELHGSAFRLTRNEIVSLFNAFGRISTSIQQLENFRKMTAADKGT